ncbi:FRAS1-related extracellular matrix protein 2 [Myotis davidii]|uniref:FRAS1-related extracellular matrix protein 2 n=1 Tax=Myotis davidii TaxID=225400 RepID=L5MBF9_MYODS|nr:FRAS1-related extracellular matrix protein 2 [Myotis davidii]
MGSPTGPCNPGGCSLAHPEDAAQEQGGLLTGAQHLNSGLPQRTSPRVPGEGSRRSEKPIFYFGDVEYSVDESAGYVEVQVWRTGTDLSRSSSVTLRSQKTNPPSANAGTDYVGISRNLDFAPGVSMQTVRVIILDDLGQPVLEGIEKLELVLRMPMNAAIGEPSKATVSINDSVSDLPKMQFKERVYTVNENDRQIVAIIHRSGDLQFMSSVRCYTRQGSAQVMMDFEERPNTDISIVEFLPGETEKPCILELMDDRLYEEIEELRLVLGTPQSNSPFGATVGEQNETLIRIRDDADKTIIKFGEIKFSINEPKEPGQSVVIKIPVIRQGDTSKVSIVRVHTKDGSATSGEDYHPVSKAPDRLPYPNQGQGQLANCLQHLPLTGPTPNRPTTP